LLSGCGRSIASWRRALYPTGDSFPPVGFLL
jgi:hypothetical protein